MSNLSYDGERTRIPFFQQEVEPQKQSRNSPNQPLLESIYVEPKWLRKEKTTTKRLDEGFFFFFTHEGSMGRLYLQYILLPYKSTIFK